MKFTLAILGGSIALCLGDTTEPPKDNAPSKKDASEKKAPEIYGLTRLLNAHLQFTAANWKALQPEEPAGRGGPGRGPGGPGGFGPGPMLAGAFLQQFDANKDGQLSREEFQSGFTRWFQAWDAKHIGSLDADAVRDGMNKDLRPTFGGPGGGGPPAPGGPGGPGGGNGLQAREGKRNGLSGMQGIDFEYVHAGLEMEDQKFANVAVRYKGNGTYMDARNSEKKSFKVELNEFTKGQKLAGQTKLNFHSNITDAAWMNESLAYALYREAGVPAPHSAYTRLFISVEGQFEHKYLGLYTTVENPDNNWAKTQFGTKKGLILKPVTRELFIDKGTDWDAYQQAYDPKTDISEEQAKRVFDFCKLITSASDEELAQQLPSYLDVDEFARFMAVTVWLSSTDSILMMGQNFIVYLHPDTHKFTFAPWDLDRSFGNFFTPSPEELSIRQAWGGDNRFLNRVMKVPAVRDAYLAHLAEFQKDLFQPEKLNARIDQLAALIRPAVVEEGADKAARFDRAVANPGAPASAEPDSPDRGPGGPGGFRMGNSKPIKDFIRARHASVAEQLAGKSEGVALGGGFGGPGRGPGGGRPGGPGGNFGPGNFLGGALLKAADADHNQQISAAEFQSLSTRWLTEWDKNTDGALSEEELRNGLGVAFPPPRFGGPPAGGER